MLADEFPEMDVLSPLSIGGTATVIHLALNDANAVWQRALAGGADVRQPLQEAFWGELYGQITDPFGHRWGIAQWVRGCPARSSNARSPTPLAAKPVARRARVYAATTELSLS